MTYSNPIILALDNDDLDDALLVATRLRDHVGMFKVGLELFATAGPEAVKRVSECGSVMLDLKLHDIPNTVARAANVARRLSSAHGYGVEYLTVHASGGLEMMRRAVEAAAPVKILAVTVLTSMDAHALAQVHGDGLVSIDEEEQRRMVQRQVLRLAHLAVEADCAGVVCAPTDLEVLWRVLRRDRRDAGFRFVTPGIRPLGSDAGDQARLATPAGAIHAGADHLVIGRPITQAEDPRKAAEEFLAEIEEARRSPDRSTP